MARRRDLPAGLAVVHPRHRVPHRAEIALAVVVCLLVYYAIANASAFTQPARDRRWPRALNVLGLAGCLTLVATLPWRSVLAGAGVFAGGLVGRKIVLARRATASEAA